MQMLRTVSNSYKARRFLKIIIALLISTYVFSIPTFGETATLRFIIYASLIILSLFVALYFFLFRSFTLKYTSLIVPFFVCFALVGTILFSNHYRNWLTLLLLCASFFVLLYAFVILDNSHFIMIIICLSLFLFTIYFIYYYRKQLLDFESFLSGSFRLGLDIDNQNAIAMYSFICFSLSLYLLLFLQSKFKYVFIISLISSFIVGVSTGSRTFFLLIIFILLIFLFFVFKKHLVLYFAILITTIAIGIGLLFLPFMDTIRERLEHAIYTLLGMANKADTSTIARVTYIDYAFSLASNNMIFGYGADGFSIYSGVDTYAHNSYAEVLCDFGIIGLFLFYSPLLFIFFKVVTQNNKDKSFVVAMVLYFCLASVTNVFCYNKSYYILLSLIFYITYYAEQEKHNKSIKKILFTCDSMGPGGAEKVISILSNEFKNIGIDVSIIGVSDKKGDVFYPINENIAYFPLLKNRKFKNPISRLVFLTKAIQNDSPDIVISFLPHICVYTMFSCLYLGIPYVVSERNNPYIDPKCIWHRLLRNLSFRQSLACIFQTRFSRDYYFGFIKEKSTIIPNPVVIPNKNSIIPSDKPTDTILAVGRLVEQKNYCCLLKAFAIFNDLHNNKYVLKIYGIGPLEETLKKYLVDLKIDNNVQFMGENNNWQTIERNSSLFVLSSDYEGMPNALLEALSIGLPCVSTDCPTGGPMQLFESGFMFLLSPVGDYEELAKSMSKMVEYDRNKVFENNTVVSYKYAPSVIANRWLNFLGMLL